MRPSRCSQIDAVSIFRYKQESIRYWHALKNIDKDKCHRRHCAEDDVDPAEIAKTLGYGKDSKVECQNRNFDEPVRDDIHGEDNVGCAM